MASITVERFMTYEKKMYKPAYTYQRRGTIGVSKSVHTSDTGLRKKNRRRYTITTITTPQSDLDLAY